jgi:tetratricopeptide (TPR) repeat protein
MLSRPNECVALTNYFLQRREVDPAQMINSRQDFDHLELARLYRTREQSLAAWQLQALCQANEGLLLPADASINQAIELAQRHPAARRTGRQSADQGQAGPGPASARTGPGTARRGRAPAERRGASSPWKTPCNCCSATTLLYLQRFDEARQAFEQIRLHALQQDDGMQQAWANYLLGNITSCCSRMNWRCPTMWKPWIY